MNAEQQPDQPDPRAQFLPLDLGACVATPGAIEAIGYAHANAPRFLGSILVRHAHGERILSAYAIDATKPCKGYGDNCVWIITEADRSATTVLLPDEY